MFPQRSQKNPALGVTVKGIATPQFTICGVGRLIVPFNPALGVTVYVLIGKVALQVELATKLNVLVEATPVQTPAQAPNVEPWSGVAVSVIEVFCVKFAAQLVPQLMPTGIVETLPDPVPIFETTSETSLAAC